MKLVIDVNNRTKYYTYGSDDGRIYDLVRHGKKLILERVRYSKSDRVDIYNSNVTGNETFEMMTR